MRHLNVSLYADYIVLFDYFRYLKIIRMLSRILPIVFAFCLTSLFASAQVVTAPYIETFQNNGWVGSQLSSSSTTVSGIGTLAPGWTRFPNSINSDMTWSVVFGTQGQYGPKGGAPFFSGNYIALRQRGSVVGPKLTTLTSPPIDITGLTSPYFQFLYHKNSPSSIIFSVEVFDGSVWQTVFNEVERTHYWNEDMYKRFGTSLAGYSDTIQIRFKAYLNTSPLFPIAFDEVRVIENPTCFPVDSIHVSTLTDTTYSAVWTSVSNATGYLVYLVENYQPTISAQAQYIIDTVYTNSTILQGLKYDTNYGLMIRPFCSSNDYAEVVGPYQFSTVECGHFKSLFYDPLNSWPISCWEPDVSSYQVHNTSNSAFLISSNRSYLRKVYQELQSPIIKLGSNDRLKFQWSRKASSSPDTLEVLMRKLGETNWNRILLRSGANLVDPSIIGSQDFGSFVQESISFSPSYANELVEIQIRYKINDSQSSLIGFKNFIVEEIYSTDLKVVSANFLSGSPCSSSNDTLEIGVQNVLGGSYNLANDPLTIRYIISGPVPQVGSIQISSGTISPNSTKIFTIPGLDLSKTGLYHLDSIGLLINTFNRNPLNDSLVNPSIVKYVESGLEILPDSLVVLTNSVDSVNLQAKSKFFSKSRFSITEICHYRTTVGAPLGGWPSYMTGDDYIEISGPPGGDLTGYQLEGWSDSQMFGVVTFGAGTILSPDGTAVINLAGISPSSPANYYYDYQGTFSFVSSNGSGKILKDPNGNVVDAVGYSGNSQYVFPANANVSAADWSGQAPYASGTSGIKLIGPDNNTSSNWFLSTDSTQDPNVLNSNLSYGHHDSLKWYYNGQLISDKFELFVGPFTNAGLYLFPVEFVSSCATYYDTAFVLVNLNNPNCLAPNQFSVQSVNCTEAEIAWSNSGSQYLIDYGKAPHIPKGNSSLVPVNNTRLSGLTPNTTYEVWLRTLCGNDTSAYSKFTFSTVDGVEPVANFNLLSYPSNGQYKIELNGASSLHANSYSWYLGSTYLGAGVNYTFYVPTRQTMVISLVVENNCGTDSISYEVNNVSESEFEKTAMVLNAFPNPADETLNYSLAGWEAETEAIVYNTSGQSVIQTNERSIDVSALMPGLYILQVRTSAGVFVAKVIVE